MVGERDAAVRARREQPGHARASLGRVGRRVAGGGVARRADEQRLGIERREVARGDDARAEAAERLGRGGGRALAAAGDDFAVREHGGTAHVAQARERVRIAVAHAGRSHGSCSHTPRLPPADDARCRERRRSALLHGGFRRGQRIVTVGAHGRAARCRDEAAVRPRPVAGAVGDVRRQRARGAAPPGPRRARAGRADRAASQPRGAGRRRRRAARRLPAAGATSRGSLARRPAACAARSRGPPALAARGVGAPAARARRAGAAHPRAAATSTCTRTSPPARRSTRCGCRR